MSDEWSELERLALLAENQRYREALEAIAANSRPELGTKEYWMNISHEACAEVLTNDTRAARTALKGDET